MSIKRIIIGITGGLATGKTTVAGMFARLGAKKIDADSLAHDILRNDAAVKARLVRIFGDEILTGQRINRKKLAKKVFSKKSELDKLCSILHPVIIRKIKKKIAKTGKGAVIAVDAPLLLETRLDKSMDMVVLVTAKRETQIKRAKERGLTRTEAGRIIARQMPLSEKARFANDVINTDVSLNETKKGVDRIWKKVQEV